MKQGQRFPREDMSDAELVQLEEELSRRETNKRQEMRKALKAVVTTPLRQRGFTGTCPHFRRLGSDRHDFLTFYFDKYGDSFVIDLGQTTTDFHQAPLHAYVPPEKRNPWYLEAKQRSRIQPGPFDGKTASWFRYYNAKTPDDFRRIAETVLPFIEKALEMFEHFDHAPKLDNVL